MIINCPNKALKEWSDLEDYFGENLAESLFHRNNGQMPTIEQATAMIKSNKIGQFKRAIRYLDTTTSNVINDMLPHFFRIVQKVGNDLYIVKGSALNEVPAKGAEIEINQANYKFINSLNKEFGNIFGIEAVQADASKEETGPESESLKNEIISDIKNSEVEGLAGQSIKNNIENPSTQDEAFQQLLEQVRDGDKDVRDAIPENIVDKVLRLSQLFERPVEETKTEKTFVNKEGELTEEPLKENANEDPQTLKATAGTYKLTVNQDALNKLAADNIDNKGVKEDRAEALSTNKQVLDNKAPRFSKAYDDATVTSVNYNVLNNLKTKFNIPFEVVNDGTLDWRGKFENGKVFVNAANMNEFTALHEYLHPFVMALQKDNAELYNNLITELQGTEEGKKVIDEIKQKYPELGTKDALDESLVTHLSRLTDSNQIKSKPWYQKFIDWFKNFFGKNGISISGLDMNLRLSDLADKIIDPTYSADLQYYSDFNNAAVMYDKTGLAKEHSERLDQIIAKIKNKLSIDVKTPAKTKQEESRKFFSGRILKELIDNPEPYKAMADYVVSSVYNAKKINEKFGEFRTLYDENKGKLSKDQMLQGMGILHEMEHHNALYNESREVVEAIRQENPDEYEDSFRVLQNKLNGDAQIINNYYEYGLKLMSDWLYPQMDKTIKGYLKSGNLEKMLGYDEYLRLKKENPNMAQKDLIEQAVKKGIRDELQHATTDMGYFNSLASGVLNSKDPISQLVGLSLKEEFSKNNDQLFKVRTNINNAIKKVTGTKLITTHEGHKSLYEPFLTKVDHWERTGEFDDKGNPIFGYVKRTAFIEPYKYDQFYKAKKEMFKNIGVRPNKNDESAYKAWEARREKWFNENTIRTYNDKGEVIKTVPAAKFINADYQRVSANPLYKEIYKHYQDANGKLGQYQLKYGIVPQDYREGFFAGIGKDKSLKENVQGLKENLKTSLGARIGDYYAQDVDGKEFKNIPIRYTKMIDEDHLSYNLGQSVADFWQSSSRYEAAKQIEPAVSILRNFIEGNSYLKIDKRAVPVIDAKGVKKLGSYVKNVTKNKDQANINRMLIDFINDTVYGESEKKANIKSPFLNLKYIVYKKGDTSANGKPHREYVYSIEDLKKKTGSEELENDHFTKGKERDVNGYGVTLLSNDKILSVNKMGRKLNSLSSTVTLGFNALAGTAHLFRAAGSNFIEASGGKYFNIKEWGSAYKDYFKALTNFDFIEDLRGGKGSLISQLLTHFGTFSGEFMNEDGKKIGQGVANKLFRRSSMFFSIHGAEHMVQTTQMLAAMKHVKVRDGSGKLIGLDKAYEIGSDGYMKLKDGVKWSEEQNNQFRDTLQSINKDRGNYSDFDKSALQRLWWGKMLIMFRRHIYNGIQRRWGSGYVDYERGSNVQGYYRSFLTSLVNEFNEYRLNGKFKKLTPDEAYYARKVAADIGAFSVAMAFIVPALRSKDQDKHGFNDYVAVFAKRLHTDMSFFYNPLEWKKIVQEPVVTGSTVSKLYAFLEQAATSPSEEYEKDGSGYRAGDSKLVNKAKKLIPGYTTIHNFHDPSDLIKFYGIYPKQSDQER